MTIAVYPGSFDPITNGHIEIIERSVNIFDKVIVAILDNESKEALFDRSYRKELIEDSIKQFGQVDVEIFSGLLVDYMDQKNASVIIRGLRVVSDFEFEFNMSQMNRKLNNRINTIFMVPDSNNTFISSSIVREVASLKGDVSNFVSPAVNKALIKKYE